MENTIASIVRKAEENFKSGETQISEYVSFNLKSNLDQIDAYINSKFVSGSEDTLGRSKPFFNIVTAARNIWFRATDLDRKNIRIKATKSEQYLMAFLASIHLQEWMKKSKFGTFLNEWGRTLATYGSAVVKFVEKDGELISEVVPWNRLIIDAVDFENNPVIEKLYFTPVQLRQNSNYNQEMVEQLINSLKSTRKNWGGQQKDNKADYIPVYELHGLLSQAQYNEARGLEDKEGDNKVFFNQMHALSFTGNTRGHNDYALYSGKEKQSPYMITHLIKEDGRSQAIGAVEHLFEAQWMVNHTAKLIKDQLDLASKIIFQTSDGNFVGKNALTNIENGEILTYQVNQPLTQLNNKPDIAAMQSYGNQWQTLAREITSTPEAMRGDTLPPGTPYALGQLLANQATSLFELMTENKGLHLEDMLRRFVIPFLKRKMDTTEEISATLASHQIKQIDSAFIPNEAIRVANEQIKKDILSGKITQQPDLGAIESQIQAKLNEKGNQRFIRPSEIKTTKWKDVLRDLSWEVEVEVTAEQSDKQAIMTTLSNVFQTIAGLRGQQMTEEMKLVFNKILETTGSISPIELNQLESQPQIPQIPQIPQGQPAQPVTGGSMGMGLQTVNR